MRAYTEAQQAYLSGMRGMSSEERRAMWVREWNMLQKRWAKQENE